MSTKQTVIFTFMILFLGVMLYAIGAYIYWSTEADNARRTIEALKEKKAELELVLNGTTTRMGLKKLIEDPERGLRGQLEAATQAAVRMKGNEVGGAAQREIFYNDKEKELVAIWPKAGAHWKTLYTDWQALNKKINDSLGTLRKQKKEKDEKIVAAQSDREKEQESERTKLVEVVTERRKMAEELTEFRVQNEEVRDKISNVMRESARTPEIVPQGRVIYAAMDLKRISVDIGSNSGLRKGLKFDIYSKWHTTLVKKGIIEIVAVRPTSADGLLVDRRGMVHDPNTGWVPPDPRMRYSVYSGTGADEVHAQPLEHPKSKADRIEAFRQEKMEKEIGPEAATRLREEKEAPPAPPTQMGAAFAPIVEGDWINNPDFVPLLPDAAHQKKLVDELLAMKDVNVSTLTFYFTDTVRPYKVEFYRRLCERNHCKVTDTMGPEVTTLVTSAGATNAESVKQQIAGSKDKEDVKADIRNLRKALTALEDAKKYSSDVVSEDDLESFFSRRQRKLELLRGKAAQPGQAVFYVAGETKDRSADELRRYIGEHGGIAADKLDAKVDFVVMGSGLDQKFFDEVRKLGLKVIREDELPRYFGLE
jgi:hypothetical protein